MAAHAERVRCPYCASAEGSPCHTANGEEARRHHAQRWDSLRRHMRNGKYVVRILQGDDRIGVVEGEEFLAESYWLDPSKVTLLRSLRDGRNPECNEYRSNVEWLRWSR